MNADSNQFVGRTALLAEAGVDVKRLGYVGLTLDPLPVRRMLARQTWGVLIGTDDYVHAAPGDYRDWIAGPVAEHNPHVTAKYGLLTPAYEQQAIVDELIGWPRDITVEVTDIEVFPSPYDDLRYGCLVARLGGHQLEEMNAALSVLPHVDSFRTYKPHMTIAYLKPEIAAYAGVPEAKEWLVGEKLQVTGIDYGKVY